MAGKGVTGKGLVAGDEWREKQEVQLDAGAQNAQRVCRRSGVRRAGGGQVPKREAGSCWKPKFTEDDTAFLITCQVISYVVTIRMACAWRVS